MAADPTAGLCDYCGHSTTHYDHTACTPEAEAARETDHGDPGPDLPEQVAGWTVPEPAGSTYCHGHGVTTPCHLCAGDHAAGQHMFGSHESTCARCAIPTPTVPTAQLDAVSLAAGDKTLTEGEAP